MTKPTGRRGPKPRAGVRATRRVEVWLTEPEYSAVVRLAAANDISVPDALRLGTMYLAAVLDEDGAPPLVIGDTVLIVERPLVEMLPGYKKRRRAD